jgi:hypothetical protein
MSGGDDWAPGDLALCVDTGISPEGFDASYLELGRIYTVYAVGVDPLGQFGLYLDELESDGFNGGVLAWRFLKIRPHTPDAEDAETIRLLTGKPVKVDA